MPQIVLIGRKTKSKIPSLYCVSDKHYVSKLSFYIMKFRSAKNWACGSNFREIVEFVRLSFRESCRKFTVK